MKDKRLSNLLLLDLDPDLKIRRSFINGCYLMINQKLYASNK